MNIFNCKIDLEKGIETSQSLLKLCMNQFLQHNQREATPAKNHIELSCAHTSWGQRAKCNVYTEEEKDRQYTHGFVNTPKFWFSDSGDPMEVLADDQAIRDAIGKLDCRPKRHV